MNGESLVKTSFLLIALTVGVKLLGFARDQTIAAVFGAGAVSDAYYLGLNFAIVLVTIVGGTFSTALVPVVTGLWDTRPGAGWSTLRSVGFIFVGIVVLVGATVVIGAPWLVRHVLGPGLPASTPPLATRVVQVLGVGFLFWAMSSALAAVLNSRRTFVPPACGPIALNATVVLALLVSGRALGLSALAIGTAVGMLAQFLVVAPFVVAAWLREEHVPSPDTRDLQRQIWTMIGPMLGFSFLSQVPPIVDKAVASGLAVGSVSILAFAQKLMQLPIGLFAGAVDVVVYTALSRAWARKEADAAAATLSLGIGVMLLLAIPAAVGLASLSQPIVQLVFQHGRFDAAATGLTSYALLFYCLGLPLAAVNFVLVGNSYARKNVRTPLIGDALVLVVNAGGDLLLSRMMGPAGIAFAGSLGVITLTAYFVASWDSDFRAAIGRSLMAPLTATLAGSALMGGAILLLAPHLAHRPVLLRLGLPGALGLGIYAVVMMVAQPREVRFLLARVRPTASASPSASGESLP